jgi:syntaxin 18
MADITNVFKATIKTVRVREKAAGSIPAGPDKSILATCHKTKSELSTHATEVVSTIRKLHDFLLEHRKDYLNTTGHLGGEQSKMTDRERDQIDADAELYIKTCAEAIRLLKSQAHSYKVLRQVKEHKEAVLDLIDRYLSAVCQLYSEQRAVRVKRVVDRKRIARLEPIAVTSSEHIKTMTWQELVNTEKSDENAGSGRDKGQPALPHENQSSNGSKSAATVAALYSEAEEPLSAEELHTLQLENEQLYEEMSSMVDEVRQIEGKIVEISRLQEIFADKVLEQDRSISKVADVVVGTTENIKEGNEQIREAMKNNAAFRIWILFFLIVCTLSLLFLDWYNA